MTRWQQLLEGVRAAHGEPPVGSTMRRLDLADAKVHRCTGCGGWLYAARPCGLGCLALFDEATA